MLRRISIALLFPALLLAIPFWLKPDPPVADAPGDADELVIISPHTEMIKYEFSRAFSRHYYNRTGRNIKIEFRNVGGTSDIVRYIDDRFSAEFRRECEDAGYDWDEDSVRDFKYGDPENGLRKRFLAGLTGIGIDLFFGGGVFDHAGMAERGYIVDSGVARRHPEYLDDIPPKFGGDTIYDPEGRFFGTCQATFGICYNPDRLKELGLPEPRNWTDLADHRYFNMLVVADPTKSGSINKCFENIIQDRMCRFPDDPERGWRDGVNLVKAIIANSRYVADSAGKVTREVASGNAAAGIAIDFYALSENEYSAANFAGRAKIFYVQPDGLAAVSPDPISILRGAPNRKIAEEFIDFVLSETGQKLWNYRPGTPGGPEKYALRRPPVRRSMYDDAHRQYMTDPDYNPYAVKSAGEYDPARTASYFTLIRVMIKCTMLDVHSELRAAWLASWGSPEKTAVFNQLILPYSTLNEAKKELRANPIATRRKWTLEALKKYESLTEDAR